MRAAGLLLVWALLRPAGSQQCLPGSPGGVLRFTDRHADIRVPALHRVPSSLDPLYGLVRRCLDLIQQNPLPTGEPRAGGPARHRRGERHPRGCGRGGLSCLLAPLPGEGWGCRGWDPFYRGFFCRAAQGSPERPRLSADVAGEPGHGAGDPTGWHPLGTGHLGHPQLGAWVLTGLSCHVGGAV